MIVLLFIHIISENAKESFCLKARDPDERKDKTSRDFWGPIKGTGKYCACFMLAVRECKWRPDYHSY